MGKSQSGAADTSEAVQAFMTSLEHPLKRQVETLRSLVLGAAPGIEEGIKWNAPSFRTSGYFATINLRFNGGIALILHLGASARNQQVEIDDPGGLLAWHGPERASLPVDAGTDLDTIGPGIQAIVRQWTAQV